MALPNEVTKLLAELKSDKEEIRKKAVITLGRYNLPEVRSALSEVMEDPSTAVRYFAKKALKDFENAAAARSTMDGGLLSVSEPLKPAGAAKQPAEALSDAGEGKAASSANATPAAAIFEGGGSITKILNDLKNPDETVQTEALKKLGEQKEVVAVEPILALIHNSSRNVRVYAVQALGLIGENRSLTPLLNLLNSEQDAFVVATLVKAIARVGGVQLIPIIARYLKDPDARTRANTVEALEIIADPKITKFLIPLIQDPNPRVKANAIKVLSRFGKTNMLEKLEEMIQSEESTIRGSAIYAIMAIGGDHGIELLEKAKNNETDFDNIQKIIEGLVKINNPRAVELLNEYMKSPDARIAEYARKLSEAENGGQGVEQVSAQQTAQPVQNIQQKSAQPEQTQTFKTPVETYESRPQPQVYTAAKPEEKIKTIQEKEQPPVRQFEEKTAAPPQPAAVSMPEEKIVPRNYTPKDFEMLWNEVLTSLYKFQKHHPDFDREKMGAFLDFLKSTI